MSALTRHIVLCLLFVLLMGCEGKNGAVEPEPSLSLGDDGQVREPVATPTSEAGELEIVEPVLIPGDQNNAGESVTLSSLAVLENSQDAVDLSTIKASNAGLLLSLNTDLTNGDEADLIALVDRDGVYVINLLSKEIRLAWQFADPVCEILPIEKMVSETDAVSGHVDFSLIHDAAVYVVTASVVGGECDDVSTYKFYHEVSLEYDASDISAPGEKVSVLEGLAKSQLISGWHQNASGEYEYLYGYLGYSSLQKRLEFYDQSRKLVWFQNREVEHFEQINFGSAELSPGYIFELTPLGSNQYMLQLGLDVFIFDSSLEVFSNIPADYLLGAEDTEFSAVSVDEIFIDRVLRLDKEIDYKSALEPLVPTIAKPLFNDSHLLLLNNFKIYFLEYLNGVFVPASPPYTVSVDNAPPYIEMEERYTEVEPFSQFDLKACKDAKDPDGCQKAHDLSDPDWQFVSACRVTDGCVVSAPETGVCVAGENCSSSNYKHLADMDTADNNLELIGYIPSGHLYVNDINLSLAENSLLMNVQLLERDVLLQYFYERELTDPKPLRERVIVGAQKPVYDIDLFQENGNLFVNLLSRGDVKSNECYRNYQKVACRLGVNEGGTADECTKPDLDDGLCFASFQEYQSEALFCASTDLANGNCIESALYSAANGLIGDNNDAKWFGIRFDGAQRSDLFNMMLMSGNHAEAVSLGQIGEGALFNPDVYMVNDDTGALEQSIGVVEGRVEKIVGGYLKSSITDLGIDVSIEGRIDIIDEEDSSLEKTKLSKLAIFNTVNAETSEVNELVIREIFEKEVSKNSSILKSTAFEKEEN